MATRILKTENDKQDAVRRAANRVDLEIMTDPEEARQCNHVVQCNDHHTHSIALTEKSKCYHNATVKQENISCLSSPLTEKDICLRVSSHQREGRGRNVLQCLLTNPKNESSPTTVYPSFVRYLSWSFYPLPSWLARFGCYSCS